jgi:hypothetical protein
MENFQHASAPTVIGFSARIGGGKDLATTITQFLTCEDEEIRQAFIDNPTKAMGDYDGVVQMNTPYTNVKYASKVKRIVAELLGTTINKLEDKTYINTTLPENWWYYIVDGEKVSYTDPKFTQEDRPKLEEFLVKLTPRRMMQLVGTEAGREIIHPDVWVNATFANYVADEDGNLPQWLISDVRFPNELSKIHEVNGISIRIIRSKLLSEWLDMYSIELNDLGDYMDVTLTDYEFMDFVNEFHDSEFMAEVLERVNHASETSLDNGKFTYVIENKGSIEDFVNEIYSILTKEGVINYRNVEA